PLVLLVAARRANGECRLSAAARDGRRECGPRTLSRLERVRKSLLEPEHLGARAEAEAERGDHRRAPEPAAARCGRDHGPEAVDDVEVNRVAARGLADPRRDRRAGRGLRDSRLAASWRAGT